MEFKTQKFIITITPCAESRSVEGATYNRPSALRRRRRYFKKIRRAAKERARETPDAASKRKGLIRDANAAAVAQLYTQECAKKHKTVRAITVNGKTFPGIYIVTQTGSTIINGGTVVLLKATKDIQPPSSKAVKKLKVYAKEYKADAYFVHYDTMTGECRKCRIYKNPNVSRHRCP